MNEVPLYLKSPGAVHFLNLEVHAVLWTLCCSGCIISWIDI